MVFSFLLSMYWRLDVRTIRRGGDLWPLHAPESVVSEQWLVVRKPSTF
jgi:hypothetical protein